MVDNKYLLFLQGPNKNIYCQLSMLKREISQGKGFIYIFYFSEYRFSLLLTPNCLLMVT